MTKTGEALFGVVPEGDTCANDLFSECSNLTAAIEIASIGMLQ